MGDSLIEDLWNAELSEKIYGTKVQFIFDHNLQQRVIIVGEDDPERFLVPLNLWLRMGSLDTHIRWMAEMELSGMIHRAAADYLNPYRSLRVIEDYSSIDDMEAFWYS